MPANPWLTKGDRGGRRRGNRGFCGSSVLGRYRPRCTTGFTPRCTSTAAGGKAKFGRAPFLQAQNVPGLETGPSRRASGSGCLKFEMIEHAYAHAHAIHSLFLLKVVVRLPILAQKPAPPSPNEAVALHGNPAFMVPLPPPKTAVPACPIVAGEHPRPSQSGL